jgi:hypothetical protein
MFTAPPKQITRAVSPAQDTVLSIAKNQQSITRAYQTLCNHVKVRDWPPCLLICNRDNHALAG